MDLRINRLACIYALILPAFFLAISHSGGICLRFGNGGKRLPFDLMPSGIGAQMMRRQYGNGVACFDFAVIRKIAFFAAISGGGLIHDYTSPLITLQTVQRLYCWMMLKA